MEKLQIVRSSQTGATKRIETVYYDGLSVPVQSLAALVLLNDMLRKQDVDFLAEFSTIYKKIGFSRDYLTRQKEIHGDLVCTYCGRPHLIIELENMRIPHRIKATIDHIDPLSNGVDFFDEKNIAVACGKCNSTKSSMPAEEFRKIVKPYNYKP